MNDTIMPASSPVTQTAPQSATEIAETMLGQIDWMSPTHGYCNCPGQARHTGKNGHRDLAVYLDSIPTIHCVHSSCSAVVAATNKKLRDAILNGTPVSERKTSTEDKARRKEREDNERLRLRVTKALPQVLKRFVWPYAQIIADSPIIVTGNEQEHWKMLLQKFQADDVVWIGDTYASGKPEHTAHFKTATDWLKCSIAPGPYICPAVFKNMSFARSNDNIIARRFLVVESDTLNRDQVGSVFRWLHEGCDLKLIAIVDTGGKSLHGWFEFEEDLIDDLKSVLPSFQCDPKLFTPSQPVRLPGVLRHNGGGKYQKLVYLSKEVAHV